MVWLRLACSRSWSSSPSHHDTNTEATPLPVMLVSARTSLMNLSTENTIAMPGTSAGNAAAALRGQHRHHQDGDLLRERQVDTERLGDEQGRQRHVDVGAVEI